LESIDPHEHNCLYLEYLPDAGGIILREAQILDGLFLQDGQQVRSRGQRVAFVHQGTHELVLNRALKACLVGKEDRC
jgi:hypothetical protein